MNHGILSYHLINVISSSIINIGTLLEAFDGITSVVKARKAEIFFFFYKFCFLYAKFTFCIKI
ncbi:unnamed protein product [Brugia timori]|uniref:Uncharacterized protein n=1 Tax=Brugia timori TaxID=42155 RepID=A0A0R3QSQ2_9BILA|nr:unnamed protein product [Brugia timori]